VTARQSAQTLHHQGCP